MNLKKMKIILRNENIEQMRKRHEKEIETLQKKCKHKEISDWMEYHFAIGHFSHYVKVCKYCGKIIKEDKPKFVTHNIGFEKAVKLGD
jgi:hypothetical protein